MVPDIEGFIKFETKGFLRFALWKQGSMISCEEVAVYYIPFLETANIHKHIKGSEKFHSKETCLTWFNTALSKYILLQNPNYVLTDEKMLTGDIPNEWYK